MSYCRWSSDSFRCDVYAYADAKDWTIHVAARKREIPDDVNDPLAEWVKGGAEADVEEAMAGHVAFMERVGKFPWVELVAPSAGQTFYEFTLEAFRDRMLALRAEGLRFPDYVLTAIDEEILAEGANG